MEFEGLYLSRLPQAENYEVSYMHRDIMTNIAFSKKHGFLITASKDGHLKFWKKKPIGIEFMRHLYGHLGPLSGFSVSFDGDLLATVSAHDQTIKVYDISSFDMICMHVLKYLPGCCEWIYSKRLSKKLLAVSFTNQLLFYDPFKIDSSTLINEFLPEVTLSDHHSQPISRLVYNSKYETLLTVTEKGSIEYISTSDEIGGDTLNPAIEFQLKSDTDLYFYMINKILIHSLSVCPDGSQFAIVSTDRMIRVFNFFTGKITHTLDESLTTLNHNQKSEKQEYSGLKLDPIDFGRRSAVEKKELILEANSFVTTHQLEFNTTWDESNNFLIYPTMLGIKIYNLHSKKLSVLLGKNESSDLRFLGVSLFQGRVIPKNFELDPLSASFRARSVQNSDGSKQDEEDPIIVCGSIKKNRFYIFSRRMPNQQDENIERDIFNERPLKDEQLGYQDQQQSKQAANLYKCLYKVEVFTERGDIELEINGILCPKTVENFVRLSDSKFYDNMIFHRVIKGSIIQSGREKSQGGGGGAGSGGTDFEEQSAWGTNTEFADELKEGFDKPFVIAMANRAKPNTNMCQWFITTSKLEKLNGKHTVFGKVIKGKEVIQEIERVRVDKEDRPFDEIKIINIRCSKK